MESSFDSNVEEGQPRFRYEADVDVVRFDHAGTIRRYRAVSHILTCHEVVHSCLEAKWLEDQSSRLGTLPKGTQLESYGTVALCTFIRDSAKGLAAEDALQGEVTHDMQPDNDSD
jgi:hypothetical protein